jgi:hypothetical protein
MQTQEINLRFDAEHHLYFLDDVNIPTLTEILKAEGIFDFIGVPETSMIAAAQFGTAVHKMFELLCKGTLDEDTVSAPLLPYLQGCKKFLSDFEPVIYPEWIESPMCSQKLRFGCTPDAIMSIKNKLTIVEIKSSSTMPPATAIQTAGQQIAFEESFEPVRCRIGIHLRPDGSYKPFEYKSLMDKTIFISALNTWRWKRENL